MGDLFEYAAAPGLSFHAQCGWRGGVSGARPILRQRSDSLRYEERTAIRGYHALIHQLLAGCARKRRLSRLRWSPLPLGLPGWDQAGRADRTTRLCAAPASISEVTRGLRQVRGLPSADPPPYADGALRLRTGRRMMHS